MARIVIGVRAPALTITIETTHGEAMDERCRVGALTRVAQPFPRGQFCDALKLVLGDARHLLDAGSPS
jgi:hypothetical protein